MRFEILKKAHLKRNIIIGVVAVAIISAAVLTFTRAKFRSTQSITLASGTINYSLADITIVGLYINGEAAEELDSSKNYTLDTTQSTCTYKDGSTISNLALSYDNTTKAFSVSPYTTKGTKCTLYFEERVILLKDEILSNSERGNGTPNFANSSCSSGCSEATVGLYEETTSKGTTYYFRGDVEDNYIEFAGFYWRIIRVNEDGSVRLIYSGNKEEVDAAGKETVLANGYDDSSTDYIQIGASAFNSSFNRSYYVGYTYKAGYQRPSLGPSTVPEEESTIKGVLDNWYNTNIGNNSNYSSKIDSSAGFCNDRTTRNTWVESGSNIYYAAYDRIISNRTPSLECSDDNDLYTTNVGLITLDEASYTGISFSSGTNYSYLYTGNPYWTMTPADFGTTSNSAAMFYVGSRYINYDNMNQTYGVRPVINLLADVAISGGNGTIRDPYIVN